MRPGRTGLSTPGLSYIRNLSHDPGVMTSSSSAETIPPLFKYVPADRLDILRDARIRFTQICALNDPSEGSLSVSVTDREIIETLMEMHKQRLKPLDPILRERELANLRTLLLAPQEQGLLHPVTAFRLTLPTWARIYTDTVSVCSFSADDRNPVMWAHYADRHRGIVIEFDADSAFNPKDIESFELFPVDYSSPEPPKVTGIGAGLSARQSVRHKPTAWEYEAEWRATTTQRFPVQRHCMPTSIVDGAPVNLFPIDPSGIRSVTLGARAPEPVRQIARALITQTEPLRHVELREASFPSSSYDMEVRTIR